MPKPQTTPPPLNGVRVVDLSRLLPGPYCTWQLASLGAEVIRVESPGSDYSRDLQPRLGEHSAFFAAINRGKRSLLLDWRDPMGREALLALIATADVLVEGFKPGLLARSGLDPQHLLERFPRLVIASISGYGQTGPLADQPGHDLNYIGLAGILAGAGDLNPPPVQVADLAGGALTAALAICAALIGRASTGKGAWLDLSMTEGAMALIAPHLAVAMAEQRDLIPGGEMLSGGYPPYRAYRCADGQTLAVAPLEPKFLAILEQRLGPLDLSEQGLTQLFASRTRDEWSRLLADACVSPALTARELPEHPQHQARGAFEPVLGLPMVCAPYGWPCSTEVPRMGQHSEEVLASLNLPDGHAEALLARAKAAV